MTISEATGNTVNPGADDDASGCSALLEMAEAFQSLKKKPRRTILFLWVSGEEIGLYGSESYTREPLFPLENTIADLNMDMIGRVKGVADSTDQTPMSGPNTVFVITGNQSSELIALANEIDKKSEIDFDYSLSGRENPLQLFSRSDHYNFVEKDIPVLFFTTGLHTDYHTPGDVVEKLDFNKMELVTRTMYEIGLEIANRQTRLVVDNPYSNWGRRINRSLSATYLKMSTICIHDTLVNIRNSITVKIIHRLKILHQGKPLLPFLYPSIFFVHINYGIFHICYLITGYILRTTFIRPKLIFLIIPMN